MTALASHRPRASLAAPVLQPQSFQDLVRFAEMAAQSDLMPRDYKGKPANIMLAVQMGSELGLSPMQAVQNISVVNGRPSVWGDALIGLVRAAPICDDVVEEVTGDGDNRTAKCTAKRKGASPIVRSFSVSDAKKAGLWGKQGPWQQYPERMLQMRARGFALRDAFPDVLRGLITAEEAQDTPRDTFTGTTIDAAPEPAQTVTQKPVDHLSVIRDRLSQCSDRACVERLSENWQRTLTKAAEAGRPIPPDVQSDAMDLMADAYSQFDQRRDEEFADMPDLEGASA